jgi:hypothetical protein
MDRASLSVCIDHDTNEFEAALSLGPDLDDKDLFGANSPHPNVLGVFQPDTTVLYLMLGTGRKVIISHVIVHFTVLAFA